jgi:hypothetical protein
MMTGLFAADGPGAGCAPGLVGSRPGAGGFFFAGSFDGRAAAAGPSSRMAAARASVALAAGASAGDASARGASGFGTTSLAAQFGHSTVRPISDARTFRRLPQEQWNRIT